MKNLRIETRVQIRADFTADQWELYTSKPGAEAVAEDLSVQLTRLVNRGLGKADVRSAMHKLMIKYREFGAADTEPYWFLEQVLEKLWPAEVFT